MCVRSPRRLGPAIRKLHAACLGAALGFALVVIGPAVSPAKAESWLPVEAAGDPAGTTWNVGIDGGFGTSMPLAGSLSLGTDGTVRASPAAGADPAWIARLGLDGGAWRIHDGRLLITGPTGGVQLDRLFVSDSGINYLLGNDFNNKTRLVLAAPAAPWPISTFFMTEGPRRPTLAPTADHRVTAWLADGGEIITEDAGGSPFAVYPVPAAGYALAPAFDGATEPCARIRSAFVIISVRETGEEQSVRLQYAVDGSAARVSAHLRETVCAGRTPPDVPITVLEALSSTQSGPTVVFGFVGPPIGGLFEDRPAVASAVMVEARLEARLSVVAPDVEEQLRQRDEALAEKIRQSQEEHRREIERLAAERERDRARIEELLRQAGEAGKGSWTSWFTGNAARLNGEWSYSLDGCQTHRVWFAGSEDGGDVMVQMRAELFGVDHLRDRSLVDEARAAGLYLTSEEISSAHSGDKQLAARLDRLRDFYASQRPAAEAVAQREAARWLTPFSGTWQIRNGVLVISAGNVEARIEVKGGAALAERVPADPARDRAANLTGQKTVRAITDTEVTLDEGGVFNATLFVWEAYLLNKLAWVRCPELEHADRFGPQTAGR